MPQFFTSSNPDSYLTRLRRWFGRWLGRSPVMLFMVIALLISGCVQSELGVRFDSPNHGVMTQQIQIGQLKKLSQAGTNQWLHMIEQRSRSLGGTVTQPSDSEWLVTIPFSNSADLEQKFNQFFSSFTPNFSPYLQLPDIKSHVQVVRSNLLLFERNHFQYDVDLRSLGVVASNGELLLSPGSLVNLEFRLGTPWGARRVAGTAAIAQSSTELVWQLIPGEQNHLEAIFWLPSPLGIGTLVIILLVLIGIYLRYPGTFRATLAQPASASDPTP